MRRLEKIFAKTRLPGRCLIACMLMICCAVAIAIASRVDASMTRNAYVSAFNQTSDVAAQRIDLDNEVSRLQQATTREKEAEDKAKGIAQGTSVDTNADTRSDAIDGTWPKGDGTWTYAVSYSRDDGSASAIWVRKNADGAVDCIVTGDYDFDRHRYTNLETCVEAPKTDNDVHMAPDADVVNADTQTGVSE